MTAKGDCQNYPNLCEWVGNPNTGSCNDLGGGGTNPPPTPPPTNGGGGGGDCTAYGDKDTCVSVDAPGEVARSNLAVRPEKCLQGGATPYTQELSSRTHHESGAGV